MSRLSKIADLKTRGRERPSQRSDVGMTFLRRISLQEMMHIFSTDYLGIINIRPVNPVLIFLAMSMVHGSFLIALGSMQLVLRSL
jgi:hypothetical protein